MKTYEYKTIDQDKSESDEQLLKRVNDLGVDGWKYIGETHSDNGEYRILLEREWEKK